MNISLDYDDTYSLDPQTWDKDNIVYDPFMGSGTTAVAAINTNRQWIGSEINQEYADLTKERTQ